MATVYEIDGRKIDGTKEIVKWVSGGLNKDAVLFAEYFGKDLANMGKKDSLSTSQIRNVFGEVRRIQMNKYNEAAVLLLRPKLAYSAKRANAKALDELASVLSPGILAVVEGDTAKKADRFQYFADFFEAVLAYHRAFEPKSSREE